MPLEPNQQPFPGQRRPISTERQPSSIPKGGTANTWVYPSPQMFYNGAWASLLLPGMCRAMHQHDTLLGAALKRKGKGDDVTEDDMGAVVHAHNSKCRLLG